MRSISMKVTSKSMIKQEHSVTMEACLHSAPTKIGRQIDDITFRTALKIRLGVEFGDRPVVCKCEKRPSVDEYADHLFNCHLFTAEVRS